MGEETWKRQRETFSCTQETWDSAKEAWAGNRREYPSWAEWLEDALVEKTARVKDALGISELPPAPDRFPTGRRSRTDMPPTRSRRTFTVRPAAWDEARRAWWATLDDFDAWSDWVEEAIVEKVESKHRKDAAVQ